MAVIYVQSKDGKPLMPTTRGGHVRHLLKSNKARVVERYPFTIRLLYDTEGITQPLYLGIDTRRRSKRTIALRSSAPHWKICRRRKLHTLYLTCRCCRTMQDIKTCCARCLAALSFITVNIMCCKALKDATTARRITSLTQVVCAIQHGNVFLCCKMLDCNLLLSKPHNI